MWEGHQASDCCPGDLSTAEPYLSMFCSVVLNKEAFF